ncbi:hypothetical protein [Paenibacillus protaetiae]|uniref:hypothetical protein n=1 Tax=Paenibacillus protaetiae TaxID=2509456 RepID=UPI001FC9458E|nr:hypothetical protein [Paenibacillus protaetiae]
MADPIQGQLLKQIGSAEDAHMLRLARMQAQSYMESVLPASPIEQFNEQLNEIHDAVIRRAIILAETEMARLGMGSPPCHMFIYCSEAAGGRSRPCRAIRTAASYMSSQTMTGIR